MIEQLIALAMLLWPTPAISVDVEPGECLGGAASCTIGATQGVDCKIYTSPGFENYSDEGKISILAHEIGHCLGIMGDGQDFYGHRPVCLMNHALLGKPNNWDFTMLRQSRPYPYQKRVSY